MMHNPKNELELLAPAKNRECAIAAINCGADAIYIGALDFGARYAAGNSFEEIETVIKYAHKYRVKVYVTINTLLNDEEVEKAVKLIHKLYEIGADAVIIQDMGLLECDLPSIPLFASTQTHNHTAEKVQFLEKAGFQRVILARELSLNEIEKIRKNTTVALESFIHGALCVSYSGQCYMSYAIGGRSSNKGQCAQPCRKKYSLVDSDGDVISENKHLLSLKDFNLSNYLKQLIEAGITSFKIEGRLKDVDYVKNVVSYYRQELDIIMEKTSSVRSSVGNSHIEFTPNLEKTFNRGYTNYFINGKPDKITAFDSPKSLGEKLGRVIDIKNCGFKLDSDVLVHNGDGICLFNEKNELVGTTINKVENGRIYLQNPEIICKNALIYRNYDHEFQKLLQKSKIERKIPVNIEIYVTDETITILVRDDEGNIADFSTNNDFEAAQNVEKTKENFVKQLSKLGDTEFEVKEISANFDCYPFIPVKDLNNLRRELINTLQIVRNQSYERKDACNIVNDFPYPEKELYFNANVINSYAQRFYNRHGAKVIEQGAETGLNLKDKAVMTTKHCLKREFGLCGQDKQLILIDEKNKEYNLEFDCTNCQMKIIFR